MKDTKCKNPSVSESASLFSHEKEEKFRSQVLLGVFEASVYTLHMPNILL